MKKVICLLIVLNLLLCGCTQPAQENPDLTENDHAAFTNNTHGGLVSASGTEYTLFANEGFLYYLGELEFVGSIQGEEKTSQHLGVPYQVGMYAIEGNDNDNILIRRAPNNEWFSIYRKSSLPDFDISAENCIRMEFVSGSRDIEKDTIHATCNGGITEKSDLTAFLSEVRSQKNPRDAGLYDLIRKPDGTLENCYICGVIYGFFEDEQHLAIQMYITSYNDLAYSISIGANEYVLPELWLQKFLDAKCAS